MKRIPMLVISMAMLASMASAQESNSQKTEPEKRIVPGVRLRLLGAPRDLSQRELAERRDAILAEDWLKVAPWFTNYAQAREAAARDSRRILAYFSRSYSP